MLQLNRQMNVKKKHDWNVNKLQNFDKSNKKKMLLPSKQMHLQYKHHHQLELQHQTLLRKQYKKKLQLEDLIVYFLPNQTIKNSIPNQMSYHTLSELVLKQFHAEMYLTSGKCGNK